MGENYLPELFSVPKLLIIGLTSISRDSRSVSRPDRPLGVLGDALPNLPFVVTRLPDVVVESEERLATHNNLAVANDRMGVVSTRGNNSGRGLHPCDSGIIRAPYLVRESDAVRLSSSGHKERPSKLDSHQTFPFAPRAIGNLSIITHGHGRSGYGGQDS